MDTDLAAVPAEAVSEVSGGGALLVHQQQTGEQPLELQWDQSDLSKTREKLHFTKTHTHIKFVTFTSTLQHLLWPLVSLCLPDILILLAPD